MSSLFKEKQKKRNNTLHEALFEKIIITSSLKGVARSLQMYIHVWLKGKKPAALC